MSDWDAERYQRISDPQFDWGQRVLARLEPVPGERILDLGCGTGRLTRELQRLLGRGTAVGLDRSGAMLAVARASALPPPARPVRYVLGDGTALPFVAAFHAIFSAATMHWILDHARLFGSVHAALAPGGRLVAQCGGRGNLDGLLAHVQPLMGVRPYAAYFEGWRDPWLFAAPGPTAEALERAGFRDVRVWIEAAPTDLRTAAAYAEFVACVCLRHHLDRLPPPLREPFVADVTGRAARATPPFVLDYQRLNIAARRPPA